MKLLFKMFSDKCPLRQEAPESTVCNVEIENAYLEYYQEMFLRILSYFSNRFLWALSKSDPYAAPEEPPEKEPIKFDSVEDLHQLDFGMDMNITLSNILVLLKERPYVEENIITLEVSTIHISAE